MSKSSFAAIAGTPSTATAERGAMRRTAANSGWTPQIALSAAIVVVLMAAVLMAGPIHA